MKKNFLFVLFMLCLVLFVSCEDITSEKIQQIGETLSGTGNLSQAEEIKIENAKKEADYLVDQFVDEDNFNKILKAFGVNILLTSSSSNSNGTKSLTKGFSNSQTKYQSIEKFNELSALYGNDQQTWNVIREKLENYFYVTVGDETVHISQVNMDDTVLSEETKEEYIEKQNTYIKFKALVDEINSQGKAKALGLIKGIVALFSDFDVSSKDIIGIGNMSLSFDVEKVIDQLGEKFVVKVAKPEIEKILSVDEVFKEKLKIGDTVLSLIKKMSIFDKYKGSYISFDMNDDLLKDCTKLEITSSGESNDETSNTTETKGSETLVKSENTKERFISYVVKTYEQSVTEVVKTTKTKVQTKCKTVVTSDKTSETVETTTTTEEYTVTKECLKTIVRKYEKNTGICTKTTESTKDISTTESPHTTKTKTETNTTESERSGDIIKDITIGEGLTNYGVNPYNLSATYHFKNELSIDKVTATFKIKDSTDSIIYKWKDGYSKSTFNLKYPGLQSGSWSLGESKSSQNKEELKNLLNEIKYEAINTLLSALVSVYGEVLDYDASTTIPSFIDFIDNYHFLTSLETVENLVGTLSTANAESVNFDTNGIFKDLLNVEPVALEYSDFVTFDFIKTFALLSYYISNNVTKKSVYEEILTSDSAPLVKSTAILLSNIDHMDDFINEEGMLDLLIQDFETVAENLEAAVKYNSSLYNYDENLGSFVYSTNETIRDILKGQSASITNSIINILKNDDPRSTLAYALNKTSFAKYNEKKAPDKQKTSYYIINNLKESADNPSMGISVLFNDLVKKCLNSGLIDELL